MNIADCHCYTCDRDIHHLGIMSHRAMHRRRQENCEIEFSSGNVIEYQFAKKQINEIETKKAPAP